MTAEPARATGATYTSPGDQWRHRIRLEHEIHDGPALRLSALTLRLGLLRHRTDDPAMLAGLQEAQDELGAVLGELRSVARQLYPPLLDEAGLGPALRQVAEGVPARVEVVDTGERFGAALEGTVYFAVVECLAALPGWDGPHDAAVDIRIGREDDHLVLAVTGPDAVATSRLPDTLRALGGTVTAHPTTTTPTITARIPCA